MTARPQHTPGPLAGLRAGSFNNGQPALYCDRGLVATMEAGSDSVRAADAAAIVAAFRDRDDLLAALKLLRDAVISENDMLTTAALFKAESAIARAEGRVKP